MIWLTSALAATLTYEASTGACFEDFKTSEAFRVELTCDPATCGAKLAKCPTTVAEYDGEVDWKHLREELAEMFADLKVGFPALDVNQRKKFGILVEGDRSFVADGIEFRSWSLEDLVSTMKPAEGSQLPAELGERQLRRVEDDWSHDRKLLTVVPIGTLVPHEAPFGEQLWETTWKTFIAAQRKDLLAAIQARVAPTDLAKVAPYFSDLDNFAIADSIRQDFKGLLSPETPADDRTTAGIERPSGQVLAEAVGTLPVAVSDELRSLESLIRAERQRLARRVETPEVFCDRLREEAAWGILCIGEKNNQIRLSLDRMPPSALHCDVRNDTFDKSWRISWDPLLEPPLSQAITVSGVNRDEGGLRLDCWNAPARRTLEVEDYVQNTHGTRSGQRFDGAVDMAWTKPHYDNGQDDKVTVTFGVPNLRYAKKSDAYPYNSTPDARLSSRVPHLLLWDEAATLTVTRSQSPKFSDQFAHAALTDASGSQEGGRSLLATAAPAFLVDTLDILAEIALQRGKKQVINALSEQLTHMVCTKLTLRKSYAVHGLVIPEGKLLPRTCETVRDLPIQEIANATGTVLDALAEDSAAFGLQTVIATLEASSDPILDHLAALLTDATTTLTDMASSGRPPDEREARALLATLASHDWIDQSADPTTCGLQFATIVAATCAEGGGCGAGTIADMVESPGAYFAFSTHEDKECLRILEGDVEFRGELRTLVARLLAVALPDAGLGDRERVHALVGVFFDFVDFGLEGALENAQDEEKVRLKLAASLLPELEGLVIAVIDVESRKAVTHGFTLIRKVLEALNTSGQAKNGNCCGKHAPRAAISAMTRTVPWITALANHAEELESGFDTEEDAAAAREARKQALEAVIDSTTSRTNRDGDVVLSVGTNLSFGSYCPGGFGNVLETFTSGAQVLPSMPMGLSAQWLPDRRFLRGVLLPRHPENYKQIPGLGLHTQFSFIDLGQFANGRLRAEDENVDWDQFLMVGIQAGVMVGSPSLPFNAGVDLRVLPTSTFRNGETRQIGVYFGYYIPFLDFN